MTAPRWEDARELFDAWVARVDLALATIGRIDDAALARLAEPAQPTAAERWRAVPEHIRAETVARLERHAATWDSPRGHDRENAAHRAEARRALAALAREAEGGGV